MSNLPKTYIQKHSAGAKCYDIEETFGFLVMDLPFPISTEVKDVETANYLDEDGEDIADVGRLHVKPHDMTIVFATKGKKTDIYDNYTKFRNYLLGYVVENTNFIQETGILHKIYSTYNNIGRQKIRLKQFDDDASYIDLGNNEYMLKIKVQFTVGDPVTDMEYSAGGINEKLYGAIPVKPIIPDFGE